MLLLALLLLALLLLALRLLALLLLLPSTTERYISAADGELCCGRGPCHPAPAADPAEPVQSGSGDSWPPAVRSPRASRSAAH